MGPGSPEVSTEPQILLTGIRDSAFIFASYAETDEQLRHVSLLAESLRRFGGRFSESRFCVYVPVDMVAADTDLERRLTGLGVEIRTTLAPADSREFYFAGKVFAAAAAEQEAAQKKGVILVWLDEDTVILRSPHEFDLEEIHFLAYRPVMHNRSGSLYSEPPDPFWRRIYQLLEIEDEWLFPMTTVADRQEIRPYFNAGLLVVRPRKGILRKWAEDFSILYHDSSLVDMCERDVDKRIFLHQTALVGAVLHLVGRENMHELPDAYNYPIFFHQQYESAQKFESLDEIVTLRYDVYFRNPDPDWAVKLRGPRNIINWLAEKLGKDRDR
jgi:hypothetical protein